MLYVFFFVFSSDRIFMTSDQQRPDSRRRAIMECSSSVRSSLDCASTPVKRWGFLTHTATALATPQSLDQTLHRGFGLVDSEPHVELPDSTSEKTEMLPLLTVPLVRSPRNPQSMVARNSQSQSLPRRILRQHVMLPRQGDQLLSHHCTMMLSEDPDVEPVRAPQPATTDDWRTVKPMSCQVARVDIGLDDDIPKGNNSAFSAAAVRRARLTTSQELIAFKSPRQTPTPLRVSPTGMSPSTLSVDPLGAPSKRVHFEMSGSKKLTIGTQVKKLSPHATTPARPPVATADDALLSPESARRRTSRARFLERMQMLKTALSTVVDDVAEEFDFHSNPNQLSALHDVVSVMDDAALGQEFMIAHPIQTVVSEFLIDDGRFYETLFGIGKQKVADAHRPKVAKPAQPVLPKPPIGSRAPAVEDGPSTPLNPETALLGRRNSAYYLQVAEARKKTSASSGDHLYAAAEELEATNGVHLQRLMPKHDQAMNEIGILGLI